MRLLRNLEVLLTKALITTQFDKVPSASMGLCGALGEACTGEGAHTMPFGASCSKRTNLATEQTETLGNSFR